MNRGALYGAIASVLWFQLKLPVWLIAFVLFVTYLGLGGYRFARVFLLTFPRDFKLTWRYVQVLLFTRRCKKNNYSVAHLFTELVRKHPEKVCFVFEDQQWTYRQVDDYSNRIAHIFTEAGFKHGETIALLLENRPDYVATWLGLNKAGLVAALINYNLKDQPLAHSIKVAESKAVIYGISAENSINGIRDELKELQLYALDLGKNGNVSSGSRNLDALLDKAPVTPLEGGIRSAYNDKMLYIYTSGTTGLPKAAVVRNSRYAFQGYAAQILFDLTPSDVIYSPLPLYHSAAGTLGVGQALTRGATIVLRTKFSANAFWSDVIKYQCTAAQYIGETCRYLLATPSRPEERSHKIRLMYGNGLRREIWKEFVTRFNIPRVAEFYGATEGNANIINIDGKIGAVGFVSLIAPSIYPVSLVRIDEETGELVRDESGVCVRCQPGEPGMFVGKIVPNHPARDFHGYADSKASQKKVACDVFTKGDKAFISGDILVMDELGYLYFKDRTGDTFRWKGENVSTSEVEGVISKVAGLKDAVVYGVEVPGSEGRAGMAAIVDQEDKLDLDTLAKGLSKVLPAYAQPLFVRLVKQMDLTGTYKLRKVDYQKQGFNPSVVKDKIFFYDAARKTYIPYTQELHKKLTKGQLRV